MAVKNLFDFTVKNASGDLVPLSSYKGKKHAFLIVNVASACGYTDGDYNQMRELYEELHSKGLEILAFPCNQFGAQEPLCSLEVKKLVESKYKVSFPIFDKIEVNGPGADPLYEWLRTATNTAQIKWNFAKFIVDRDGTVIAHKDSNHTPLSLKPELEALL